MRGTAQQTAWVLVLMGLGGQRPSRERAPACGELVEVDLGLLCLCSPCPGAETRPCGAVWLYLVFQGPPEASRVRPLPSAARQLVTRQGPQLRVPAPRAGRVAGDPWHSELRGSPPLQLSTLVRPCLGCLRPGTWGPGWRASAHLPSRRVQAEVGEGRGGLQRSWAQPWCSKPPVLHARSRCFPVSLRSWGPLESSAPTGAWHWPAEAGPLAGHHSIIAAPDCPWVMVSSSQLSLSCPQTVCISPRSQEGKTAGPPGRHLLP